MHVAEVMATNQWQKLEDLIKQKGQYYQLYTGVFELE